MLKKNRLADNQHVMKKAGVTMTDVTILLSFVAI